MHTLNMTVIFPRHCLSIATCDAIEKEEADRELDNKTKRISNKYAKRAYIISILALLLSVAAIIVEILSKTIWKE